MRHFYLNSRFFLCNCYVTFEPQSTFEMLCLGRVSVHGPLGGCGEDATTDSQNATSMLV